MNIIKNIGVFGDSILKGIQINPDNQRYHVDNHIDIDSISRRYSASIENYSKFGCTVTKGYEMIKKRLNLQGFLSDTIVMDFGGNDCDFDWKAISEDPSYEHQPKTPIDIFVQTYRKLIQLLKKNSILPVLATLPPLAPQRFFDWFCCGLNKENVMKWLGDVNTIYRYQEAYSRSVEMIARKESVPLVDLRGAFLRYFHLEDLLCIDGVHPNTEGQKVITAAFLEYTENRY